MLSVVDAMVGRPASELLPQLAVHPSVASAVLEGKNELGSVLGLVTAYERGDWQAVEASPAARGIDARTLDAAYKDSLLWAEGTAAA
jgi:EAL and modified HD-GYP domain-containing signal transduction protein